MAKTLRDMEPIYQERDKDNNPGLCKGVITTIKIDELNCVICGHLRKKHKKDGCFHKIDTNHVCSCGYPDIDLRIPYLALSKPFKNCPHFDNKICSLDDKTCEGFFLNASIFCAKTFFYNE